MPINLTVRANSAAGIFSALPPPVGDADWVARSTAPGVLLAKRLNTQAEIDLYTFPGGWDPSRPSLDTVNYPDSSGGSLKIPVLNDDTTSSATAMIPFGASFGNGSTFWVSYRIRTPKLWAMCPWPSGSGQPAGSKIGIVSSVTASNVNNELVITDSNGYGGITGYYQDGSSYSSEKLLEALISACSTSDYRDPTGIDRSVRTNTGARVNYPLTGVNPDTGAGWTACEQDRARYGMLYSARGGSAPDYAPGIGDPLSGVFRFHEEWWTVIMRVIVGTLGTASNRWSVWAARQGQAPVLQWDISNIVLGDDFPYSAAWLLPYTTDRIAGGRSVSSRTSNIPGCAIWGVGNQTPVGVGTLEYNASTQRFRWLGAGQSFGAARGFSVANNKLFLNLLASPASSYLAVEVTPAGLPSSGTHTDSVTIAGVRPNTQINFADFILSLLSINAPGGFPPIDLSGGGGGGHVSLVVSGASLAMQGSNVTLSVSGGGGGGSLASAAAALSPNQTTLFTMSSVPTISAESGSSILEYVSRCPWDAAAKKIRFVGISHSGNGWAQYCEYNAITGVWTQELVPDGRTDPRHAYSGVACNDAGTLVYHEGNAGSRLWKRTAGGVWTSHTNPQAGWAHVEWSPGLGKFVIGQCWGIRTFDPVTNAFALLRDTPSGTDMTDNAGASGFSEKDGCVYVGNSSGSPAKVWKVGPTGVCTQITNPPIPAAVQGSGNNFAMLIGAANAANKMLEVAALGQVHEYDEVANTWSAELTSIFPAALKAWLAGAYNNQWIGCRMSSYGVIAFMRELTGNTMDPQTYLWKH